MQKSSKVNYETNYFLISFAPSSGVGFYELEEKIHQFDLITEDDIILEGSELIALKMEFDQINIDKYFKNLKNLLSFATQEYLRDKKDNYYIMLLTQHLDDDLHSQTLNLLNSFDFYGIAITKQYIHILKEIVDVGLVFSIIHQASKLKLTNVKECIIYELNEIIFSEKSMNLLVSKYFSRDICDENLLIILSEYTPILEKIPRTSLNSFKILFHFVENKDQKLNSSEIYALKKLMYLVQYESPKILLTIGISYRILGKYSNAIDEFNRALELNPDFAEVWNNKGIALIDNHIFEQAKDAFNQALELNPNYAEAWHNRGLALLNLKNITEAIACYDKAIEIKPNFAEAWHGKGCAFLNLEKYNLAIENIDNAIRINPNFVEAWNNKGCALFKLSKIYLAINCFNKVLDINPNFMEAEVNKKTALDSLNEDSSQTSRQHTQPQQSCGA